MLPNFLKCLFLASTFIVTVTFAEAKDSSCEALFHPAGEISSVLSFDFLDREFSRVPNDEKRGLVTEAVPVSKESLLAGYAKGLFPFETTADGSGRWFDPPERGIMILSEIKIGKSDLKDIKKLLAQVKAGELRITEDQAFGRVIRECKAQERLRRDAVSHELIEKESWISDHIVAGYEAMFASGHAHSVEIWRGAELVGGLYGSHVNGVFSGESMFHKESNVTKLAFWYSLKTLAARGFKWVDTQVAVPAAPSTEPGKSSSVSLTVKWGAHEVSRDSVYRPMLREAQNVNLPWKTLDREIVEREILRGLESEGP